MRTPHPRAILPVSDERQLPRRKLTADLMEASRLKLHLDERERCLCLQYPVCKRSLLHAGALPLHRKHFLLHLILIKKVLHLPTHRRRHPRDDTEVGLSKTVLRQLAAELARRLTIPCQHEQSRRRFIKPVHDIIIRRPIAVLLRKHLRQIMLRILTGRLADDRILRCLMNDLHVLVFFSLSCSSGDATLG